MLVMRKLAQSTFRFPNSTIKKQKKQEKKKKQNKLKQNFSSKRNPNDKKQKPQ